MDNNFFNGQDNMGQPIAPQQPFGQPDVTQPQFGQPDMTQQTFSQPEMTQPQGGFTLANDVPQQSQFAQPGMAPQQPQFGQPDMVSQQPQFAQPGMAPQQPQFAQPGMAPQPPVGGGKPPKVKKPMTSGKLAAIIGGGVALVALIVCGILFIPKLFKPAKDVVVDAFENTFEVETVADDVVGMADINKAMLEKGCDSTLNLYVNEVAGIAFEKELALVSSYSYDPVNMLVNAAINLAYADSNLFTINVIGDETNTYVQLPDMIDGYFSLPNEGMLKALENSPLGQSMGLTGAPNYSVDYFSMSKDEETAVNSDFVNAIEGLWDKVVVEKEGNAKIDVNGNTVKAKEYVVTIKEEDLEAALESMIDGMTDMMMDPSTLESSGMSIDEITTTMSQLKALIPTLVDGDFVVKVFIKDKKVVKVTSEDDINIMGATMSYDFFFDYDEKDASAGLTFTVMGESINVSFDADDIHGDAVGKLSFTGAGQSIDINFNVDREDSDASSDVVMNAEVTYNGTQMATLEADSSYNKSTYDLDGSVVVTAPNDDIDVTINYAGGYKDINKGVSYTFALDTIEVLVNDESLLKAGLDISLDTSKVSATGLDTSLPVYDLTVIDETEFNDILTENEAKVTEWMLEIMSNEELLALIESLDLGSDDDWEEEPVVDDDWTTEPEEEEPTDDMIIEDGDHSVEILGTIAGFEFDYEGSYYIDFMTEEWSMLSYEVLSGEYTAQDVLSGYFYLPSDDTTVYDQAVDQTYDLNGEQILYSWVQYQSGDYKVSTYTFVKDLGNGSFLIVDAYIYDDDDAYTVDDLVQALSSQYYSVIN